MAHPIPLPVSNSNLNKNVSLILVFNFLWLLTRSLWESANISAYIFLLEHRYKSYVGYAASIEGLAQLLVSIPAGILSDRFRRDSVLRISAFVSIASLLFTAYAVYSCNIILVYVAMAFWGTAYALNDAPMESVFADSTTTGTRSEIYVTKFILMQAGRGFGSVIVVVLFYMVGNEWVVGEVQIIIYVGLLLTMIPAIMQAFVNDDYSLSVESEASDSLAGNTLAEPLIGDYPSSSIDKYICDQWVVDYAPIMVAGSDLLTALGAGATVKFFSLFFIEEFMVSPTEVGLLFAMTPFACCVSSMVSARIARRIGRINAVVIAHVLGASLLFVVAVSYTAREAVIAYIIRTAVMNSFKPLKRSLLMDIIPKKRRGYWNSLESVTVFSWTGSAAIGGIIVDHWGYRVCFVATGFLYLISSIPMVLLSYWNLDRILSRRSSTPRRITLPTP
uniref:Major facilitator superfamily (MFS) profile domain-containing protein n=1 Tax=Spongospora subterranea TaxID=70186 RepID=A0A0H5QP86_9EUKA|eukprot:CRZ03407.1 hypothetical protein [Spongospora subterranea]